VVGQISQLRVIFLLMLQLKFTVGPTVNSTLNFIRTCQQARI
jgi:hypothetical protein